MKLKVKNQKNLGVGLLLLAQTIFAINFTVIKYSQISTVFIRLCFLGFLEF